MAGKTKKMEFDPSVCKVTVGSLHGQHALTFALVRPHVPSLLAKSALFWHMVMWNDGHTGGTCTHGRNAAAKIRVLRPHSPAAKSRMCSYGGAQVAIARWWWLHQPKIGHCGRACRLGGAACVRMGCAGSAQIRFDWQLVQCAMAQRNGPTKANPQQDIPNQQPRWFIY